MAVEGEARRRAIAAVEGAPRPRLVARGEGPLRLEEEEARQHSSHATVPREEARPLPPLVGEGLLRPRVAAEAGPRATKKEVKSCAQDKTSLLIHNLLVF